MTIPHIVALLAFVIAVVLVLWTLVDTVRYRPGWTGTIAEDEALGKRIWAIGAFAFVAVMLAVFG